MVYEPDGRPDSQAFPVLPSDCDFHGIQHTGECGRVSLNGRRSIPAPYAC